MKSKRVLLLLWVVLLTLIPISAWAGGWAAITLDSWPQEVVAGEAVEVGFIVRQHGRDDARMSDLTPTVSIRNPESGESAKFKATHDGTPGHYVASLVFPSAGVWDWSVAAFTLEQPLPELTVLEPQALSGTKDLPKAGRTMTGAYPLLAGGLGLALLVGAAVLGRGRRKRLALALVVVGLAAASVGLAAAAAGTAEPQAPVTATPGKTDGAALGEALFVAKGCVQCHRNDRLERELVVFSTEMGPNLTNYTASTEYLRVWLKDPKAAKPQTQMPDLGLSEMEMEALIAYLSQKP